MKKLFLLLYTFVFIPLNAFGSQPCISETVENFAKKSGIVAKGKVVYSDYGNGFSLMDLAFWRWRIFREGKTYIENKDYYHPNIAGKLNFIDIENIEILKGETNLSEVTLSFNPRLISVPNFSNDYKRGETLLLFLIKKDGKLILNPTSFHYCRRGIISLDREASFFEKTVKLIKNSN